MASPVARAAVESSEDGVGIAPLRVVAAGAAVVGVRGAMMPDDE